MRLLRGKSDPADDAGQDSDVTASAEADIGPERAYTPGKGRPTRTRREAEGRRRGPAPPPPRTQREALRRMRRTRKERRGDKATRRQASAVRRERMMAGDEKYLMARDRGPDKALARDLVDSRRSVVTMFMPLALLILLTILVPSPAVAQLVSLVTMAMLLIMVVEAILLGRMVNRRVRERFPDTTASRVGLGFYAFTRATQLRRLRVPKPRVAPGTKV